MYPLLLPINIVYEIIFDFFHYWTHRLSHKFKFIYQYIHKLHHKFDSPSIMTALYMNPIDNLFTVILPLVITFYITPHVCTFLWDIFFYRLLVVEIFGHSGKIDTLETPLLNSVFPRYKEIRIYIEDHDLHHSNHDCNFSKKYTIWDKIFKTYKKKNLYVENEKFRNKRLHYHWFE